MMVTGAWEVLYLLPSFIIGGCFLLVLVKKQRDRRLVQPQMDKDETVESLANPVAITAVLILTLIYTAFVSDARPLMPYPLDMVTIIIYLGFVGVFAIVCLKEQRTYTGSSFEVKDEAELELKYELIRKTTHLVIMVIVACYMVFGVVFGVFVNLVIGWLPVFGVSDLGVPPSLYPHYTVVFFTMISFLCLSTSEVVRIFFYRAYPLKGVKAIFRRKEVGAALGSHISLTVGCMAVILLFGFRMPEIVMASISISAIGDGAAGLVGRRFGKHRYKTAFSTKQKTLEGLITAILVSFVLSFIFLIYRYGVFSFGIAFTAVGVMALIDWLSPRVSDNLLNPIATAFAMVAVTWLLGMP